MASTRKAPKKIQSSAKGEVRYGGHSFRVDFNALSDFEEANGGRTVAEVFAAGTRLRDIGFAVIRAMAYAFCRDFQTKEAAGDWLASEDLSGAAEAIFEAVMSSGYLTASTDASAAGDAEGEA